MSLTLDSYGHYKRLWKHISPNRRKQLGLLCLLMLLASVTEVVTIGALLPFLGVLVDPQQIFNSKLVSPLIVMLGILKPEELILPLTLLFISAVLTAGILRILLLWSQTRLGQAIGADLSFKIYSTTLYQPYTTHVSRNSSEVISSITEKINAVIGEIIFPLLSLASSAFLFTAIIVTLISIEPFIAISLFVCFSIIYIFIMLGTRKILIVNGQKISSLISKRVKALQEGLGGIRDVILNNTQSTYTQIYRDADLPLRRAQATNKVIAASPRFGIEALGMTLIAAFASMQISKGYGINDAIPVFGALVIGAQRMLPVLQLSYASWSSIKGAKGLFYDALELLEQPSPAPVNDVCSESIKFESAIVTKNLCFSYTPETPWVLRNLDLEIKKGSRIGFIGATGSGKSTLFDILMGLLEPSDGQLIIDKTLIDKDNHRSWRANISHVPQSIFLADTTIAENIAFGIPLEEIDRNRVQEAAKMAQIADSIESWERKYETIVGERGVRLSGGQRQRIGIARALYRQANVIFFDEATSSLDNETEQAVTNAIDNISRETTILIIAHRMTSLVGCDLVIELENGTIKRKGCYKEMTEQ